MCVEAICARRLRRATFAAYTLAIALELTAQLARFTAMPAHVLAGHAANFDFWVGEVAHCLAVIDTYEQRFQKMLDTQQARLRDELSSQSLPEALFLAKCDVPRPGRMAEPMRRYVRSELCRAFREFALTSHRNGFVAVEVVQAACQQLSIDLE